MDHKLTRLIESRELVEVDLTRYEEFTKRILGLPSARYKVVHSAPGCELCVETDDRASPLYPEYSAGFGWYLGMKPPFHQGFRAFLNPHLYGQFTSAKIYLGPWGAGSQRRQIP